MRCPSPLERLGTDHGASTPSPPERGTRAAFARLRDEDARFANQIGHALTRKKEVSQARPLPPPRP